MDEDSDSSVLDSAAPSSAHGAATTSDTFNLAARVHAPFGSPLATPRRGYERDEHGPRRDIDAPSYNLAAQVHAPPPATRPLIELPPQPETVDAPQPAEDETGAADTGGAGTGAAPQTAVEEPPSGRGARTFESLKDPDFRWFFASMFGHFTSMNMQMFIRGWLIFQLTGSFSLLGAIQLASAVPQLLFSLVGGVLADQVRQKKWVVQVGQLVNALNALFVGLMIATGNVAVVHLFTAAAIQGTVNALMMPSRQAMAPEIVGEHRLMNALALNTAGMNFARLVMPGFAGWFVAAVGHNEGASGAQYIYFMMVGLYLSAVLFLFKVPNSTRRRKNAARTLRGSMADIADGFRYIRSNQTVGLILLVNLLIVSTSMPYFFLLPGFVEEVLGGGVLQIGLLTSISGIGALAGSLLIASLPSRNRGRIMLLSSLLLGIALVGFAASTWFWVSAAIFIVVGLGQSGRMSLSNVLVQSYTDDEYRGRVMSIYMMEFSITMFGTFAVALLADAIGPQWAIGGTAVALIVLVSYLLLFVPKIRDLD